MLYVSYGNNMDFYTQYNILPYLGSPVINLDAKEQFVENSKG